MRKCLLLIALLSANITYILAQPYCDVRAFSLQDGLAANVISGMGQTPDGLMWFGTWNGLSYYDGYSFTTYRDTPGKDEVLSSNRILKIQPNSNNDVWVITSDRQLYLFDTRRCKYISINKLVEPRVKKPVSLRWVSPSRNGYTLVTGEEKNGVTLRIKDDDVEGSGGIQILKGSHSLADMFDTKEKGWQGKNTFVDSKHRVWSFAVNDGVAMKEGSTTRILQATASNQQDLTTSTEPFIHEDEHGTVWVVPNGGTFSYYDELSRSLVPYPLHSADAPLTRIPAIRKYFIDNQDNMWFTGVRNLICLNFRMRHVRQVVTFPGRDVRALLVDKGGNTWVGDGDGMLAAYDGSMRLRGYLSPSGQIQNTLSSLTNRIYALYQDRKGRLWIGAKGNGLYCVDNGEVTHFTHNDADKWSLSHNYVYDIAEDTKGRLWIATYERGLNLLDESSGKARFINVDNLLRKYPEGGYRKIRRVTVTRSGTVMLSTNGGLVTFSDRFSNAGSISFYTTTHRQGDVASLAGSDVLQTLVTKSGTVYVSTMGGSLQKTGSGNLLQDGIRLKDVTAVTHDEGLIQSMVEDNDQNIWLIRETTIDKYNPKTNIVSTLGAADLSCKVEFSEAKPVLSSRNGHILVGCSGCFLDFNPRQLAKSNVTPKIMFTNVRFQGDAQLTSVLNTPELDVPSGKRSLTVYFAALDYSDNSSIRYAYKLESDDKWSYVGGSHSASFNHLPHGHLRLLVRSTNADGVWQDNTRALNIYAHPTFWESWMGWLLYIVIGGGLIFLAAYMYSQQKRIQMQAELRDLMAQFFTNIGHKLRTPLTLIGGPVAEVLREDKLSDKQKELLGMVQRNSENMLGLVNSMLEYKASPSPPDGGDVDVLKSYPDFISDDTFVTDTNTDDSLTTEGDGSSANQHPPYWGGLERPSGFDTKLLVVEDNRDLRRFLFTILSSDYSVLTAENGKEGLEKARSEMPDFIISDVMMPVMDGLTMVHEIKQDKNTSHIPIIILSAKASMRDRLQGLHEGIDDYITKPFSATYLKERVANIIARRKSMQQEVLAQLSTFKEERVESGEERGERKEERGKRKEERDISQDNQEGNHKPQTSNLKPQTNEYRLSSPVIIDEDKVMMEKLMAYLEKHIDDSDLKMEDMAQAVNLGRTVFYGKMKSIVGMAPVEFVRHIRMQRAEELIVKSKESFSQIAYAVGFTDPKYFSKCFKKETGMSPSEYRAKGKMED